ncbi:MAG: ribosome silencing factor [Bacteroidaceae bacterium]|nr:ribosome silencing factor [Bacteroidaceae bacterium]
MDIITQELIDGIIAGIENKKGRDIQIVDLSEIEEAVTDAFVICTGGSPTQVQAIADSVEEECRKNGDRPSAVAGLQNAIWVAMDYGNVMVHIFLEEAREFYDLEHLWADADVSKVAE